MGAVVFAFGEGRSSHRPWQNHELAEFYRAIDILGRAGLVVVPDMGISDEGDPWFAFCRGDTGDVIVHIARIDGLLVATSIASKEIIRGAEMRNIIDAVTRIAPLGMPVADADRRLFLHPAVVLTAFIAAALAFTKQAAAQETHSSAASKGAESHASPARMVLVPKVAADAFGPLPLASVDGSGTLDGSASLDASISLAALMSAATAVVGPAAVSADHDPTTMQSELLPSARPDEHSPLHPLAHSLVFPVATGDAVAQESGPPQAASTVVANWHLAGDVTPGSATLAVPGAAADLSPQSGTFHPSQPTSDYFATVADNIIDHVGAPPAHLGTVAVTTAATVQSSPVAPATPDPSHGVDLSTISPVALAVLLGGPANDPANAVSSSGTPDSFSPTADASHAGTGAASAHVGSRTSTGATSGGSSPTADASDSGPSTDVASPPSSVSVATPAAQATSPPATPTIVIADNPNEALAQLLDYGLTNHPMTGTFAVSPVLALVLPIYTAEVPQPVRLIVFDSTAVSLSIFELTKGVVFVSDHELGVGPAQTSPANVVTVDLANGGAMTLLGVVDTAHLTS